MNSTKADEGSECFRFWEAAVCLVFFLEKKDELLRREVNTRFTFSVFFFFKVNIV